MTSKIFIYAYVLILLSCTMIFASNEVSPVDWDDSSIAKDDIFLQWYRSYVARSQTQPVSSTPSNDLQRRNVILPRICYFSRVTKSGIYQKLCLPYDRDTD